MILGIYFTTTQYKIGVKLLICLQRYNAQIIQAISYSLMSHGNIGKTVKFMYEQLPSSKKMDAPRSQIGDQWLKFLGSSSASKFAPLLWALASV